MPRLFENASFGLDFEALHLNASALLEIIVESPLASTLSETFLGRLALKKPKLRAAAQLAVSEEELSTTVLGDFAATPLTCAAAAAIAANVTTLEADASESLPTFWK